MQDLSLLYGVLLLLLALIWVLFLASGKHLYQNRKLLLVLAFLSLRFVYRVFLVLTAHGPGGQAVGEADFLLDTFMGIAVAQALYLYLLHRLAFYSQQETYRLFLHRLSVASLGVLLFVFAFLLSPLRYNTAVLHALIALATFYELSLYLTAFFTLFQPLNTTARPAWRIVLITSLAFFIIAPFMYAIGLMWGYDVLLLQSAQSAVYLFGLGLLVAFFQDPDRALALDQALVEIGRRRTLNPLIQRLLLEKELERKHLELQVFNPERYLESLRTGNWARVLEPIAGYLQQDTPHTPVFLAEINPLERELVFRYRVPPEGDPLEPLAPPRTLRIAGLEHNPQYFPRQTLTGEESVVSILLGQESGALTLPLTVGFHTYLLWIPTGPERAQNLMPWLQTLQQRIQTMLSYAFEYLKQQETNRLDEGLRQALAGVLKSSDLNDYLDKLCTAMETVFPDLALLTISGLRIEVVRHRGNHASLWHQLAETLSIYDLRRLTSTTPGFQPLPPLPGVFSFTPLSEDLVLAVYRASAEEPSVLQQIREDYFFSQVYPFLEQHLRDAYRFFREKRVCWFSQRLSETIPREIGSLNTTEVAHRILQTSLKLTEYPAVSLFLVDQENPHRVEYVATAPEHMALGAGARLDLRASAALLTASATLKPVNSQYEQSDLLARSLGFKGWAVFPLHLDANLLGFLVFHAQQPRPALNTYEIQMLEQFTHLVSFILFWALSQHRFREQEESAQKLLEALTELLSITNEESLQKKLVDLACDLMEGDAASFMVYNPQERMFVISQARGLSETYVKQQRISGDRVRDLMGGGYTPVYVRDLQQRPYGDLKLIQQENLRSAIAVFVRRSGEVYGLLNVYSKEEVRTFSGTRREVFSYLALLASSLLENIYLYHSALRQSKILETLNALGRQIIRHIHDPEASWQSLLAVLADLLNCRTVQLLRFREDTWVEVYNLHRRDGTYEEHFWPLKEFQKQHPEFPDFTQLETADIHLLDNRYVLYLTRQNAHGWYLVLENPLFDLFEEAYMDILQGISDLLSLGILGMEHFQNERRRSEDMAFVNRFLRLAFTTDDFEVALEKGLETLAQRLQARWVALVDPRKTTEEHPFRSLCPRHQKRNAEHALKKYRDRLLQSLRRQKPDAITEGTDLYLAVPLIARQGPQGVLFLHTTFREFDPLYTPSFLTTLASELAAVLENYTLLQQTREHARRLEQAQQQLVESSKLAALGSLAAGVAHEIKNPLFIIQGTLDLWARKREFALPGSEIEKVKEAIWRIDRIIRSLLDYARSSQETAVGTVFINDAIEKSLDMMIPAFQKEGITVETDLQPDLPPIKANRGEIQQIVTNLVQNARDAIVHSGKGSRIVVSSALHNDTVEISVWDNGPGIPEDLREKIFDPFFTTKAPGEGTGLGLAIVQRIVNNLKGSIEVESEEGQYTRFVVRFPYVPAEFGTSEASKVPDEERASLQGKRILVVDDEESITRVLEEYLTDLGAQVIAFTDPKKARLRARMDRFDAVILDIRMPGISGFDLFKDMQARNPHNACRTVFLTGGLGDPEIQRYLEDHHLPYLIKPVELDELRRIILEVLRTCESEQKS